ncbi:MAG: hypothetical protein V2I38_03020 [Alcanivoracaceae bacterium]|nr:hypothetical protein [Alcanivoracaceae bacterium]
MHKIIFRGQVQAGHDSATVRENLAKLFRIEDAERLDSLFSGKAVTIKKSLDEAAARKYLAALEEAGARVEIEPPLADLTGEDLPDFTDFPEMPAEQDLSFATVMQSFSDEPAQSIQAAQPDNTAVEIAPEKPRRAWWPLAAGAAAALLVAATFIFWPGDSAAPLSSQQQADLEALFAIAGEGSDEQFSQALAGVSDPDIRKAMHELRAMVASVQDIPADDSVPEFDMQALRDIAENSSAAEFDAAVKAEADVDARRILLELRAAHENNSQ